MLQLFVDNKEVEVKWLEFSDGAITCKIIDMPSPENYVSISVDPSTPCKDVAEEVTLLWSAIGLTLGYRPTNFYLNLPYLPYARADRVFEEGNPAPLGVFLGSLELLNFDKIFVDDPHNEYAIFLDNMEVRPQHTCFFNSLPSNHKKDWDVVVAPDKGAVEKSKVIAEMLGCDIVFADKVRDVTNGQLKSIDLPDYDFSGKKVLIPDDISDAGGTHIWTASLLKGSGASEVDLFITHLIAAKGLEPFKKDIDKIYYTNIIGKYINQTDVMNFNRGEL